MRSSNLSSQTAAEALYAGADEGRGRCAAAAQAAARARREATAAGRERRRRRARREPGFSLGGAPAYG